MSKIIFYSTHCPQCKVLEKKLQAAGIEYVERNDIDQMLDLGIKSAPALSVDGEILGFKDAVKWVKEQEGIG